MEQVGKWGGSPGPRPTPSSASALGVLDGSRHFVQPSGARKPPTETCIESAGMATRPVFRSITRHGQVQAGRLSGIDVGRVVQKLAVRAGLDPAMKQPGIGACRWCGAISGMRVCSGRIAGKLAL
jgi:hypothetical protein